MNDRYHNLNFFMAAIQAYKVNFLNAVLVSVALLLVEWVVQVFEVKYWDSFLTLMLVASFAYAIHYTILFGENAGAKALFAGKEINRFFWRSMIFLAVFMASVLGLAFIVLIVLGDQFNRQTLKGILFILAVIIGLPVFGASFAIWGTMLPATVAGNNASFKASWQRAKGNFWYTFLRLVIGPFFVTIAFLSLAILLAKMGVPFDYQTADGGFDVIGLFGYLALQMASLFSTALAASVLCKTYLRSRAEVPATAT